ncbi:uncharacterized protein LOC120006021 [Tripterygium wilfordii]|uniref:uncharacterized protein LOC120006021 n=1 Tax=Tripterygium wilfordii TaxID=458696 RepID=UPI0018F85D6E|nr:uncharacterized protein LOC120006021 [Tripterygium wilfordii]
MACERGGNYRSLKNSTKLTGSKKCNCPFRLKRMKLETNDDWMIRVLSGIHNHPATVYMEGHSFAGKLSTEENNIMIDMSTNLVEARNILSTLKSKDPENVSTIKKSTMLAKSIELYNIIYGKEIMKKKSRTLRCKRLVYGRKHNIIEAKIIHQLSVKLQGQVTMKAQNEAHNTTGSSNKVRS